MLRSVKNGINLRHFDKLTGIHHRQPVHQLRLQTHVVTNQQDRGTDLLLYLHQGLRHHLLRHHVERARRLVGNDHLWLQKDRQGDADPLFHAAAQFVGIHLHHTGGQIDQFQGVADLRAQRGARRWSAMLTDHIGQLMVDAQHGVKRIHGPLGH